MLTVGCFGQWKAGLLLALCCGQARLLSAPLPAAGAAAPQEQKPTAEVVAYTGCCDASAGISLTTNLFAVANDEDNVLRIYRRDQAGPPVKAVDFSRFLEVDPRKPESDLEGATRVGDIIYWITSHGQNRAGLDRESRHRLFATRLTVTNPQVALRPVGQPYRRLLEDLIADPRFKPFKLDAAARLPPKSPGGLNIEALCATPEQHLLIGFRNPIPKGKALLAPLLNPAEVITGLPPRFGEPKLLDLGGLGFRDLAWRDGRYVIAAGPYDGKGKARLYAWDGVTSQPQAIKHTYLKNLHPEAILYYPDAPTNAFQVLSDDGTRKIEGQDCKTLPFPWRRQFRSLTLQF